VAEPQTAREWIERRADTAADSVFLIAPETGREIGNRELRDALYALGAQFAEWKIPPGGVLAAMVGNGLAAAQLFLGCLFHGRIFLPLNLAAGDGQIAYALAHSGAKILLADEDNRVRAAAVTSGGTTARLVAIHRDEFIRPQSSFAGGESGIPCAADNALLIYTSGTTGKPKGVLHTHKSLLAGGRNVALAHRLDDADRALCVLPLCHINGLCVTILGPLVSGGGAVIPHRFSVGKFWRIAEKHRCSWLSVVPTQVAYLLNSSPPAARLPDLRFARSASAPLAADALRQFEERFAMPMLETMGLTETAAQILANPPPPEIRKPGSPGIPFGCEVAVLDANGQAVAPGADDGEIAVRGDNVMAGYLNNPEATAEAFTDDGWLLTGDLGRQDADGYFYVAGRRKELIIKGGENIAPREIDESLLAAGGVLEAAAFARPCPVYGQTVEAAVVLSKPGAHSESELIARCVREVGDFRAPGKIHFVDELPKGPSGKVQRLRLAEMICGAQTPPTKNR
jgi:acyl-CoA synthetase (AMP-forming)/AMP-acid ligase II